MPPDPAATWHGAPAARWLRELDLGAPWLRLGTRRADAALPPPADPSQFDERARLWRERPDDVLVVAPEFAAAVDDVSGRIPEVLGRPPSAGDTGSRLVNTGSPLAAAGLAGVDDLCLLQRRDALDGDGRPGWFLDAGFVAFPSRWRLVDKVGRRLDLVHAPVDGYAEALAARVDAVLDALDRGDGSDVRGRRNWFVHPDSALFQPSRPVGGDPVVPAAEVRTGLWVRSEWQTLRSVAPGWVLFTIRIDQVPLGEFVDAPTDRAADLLEWLHTADPATVAHHGMSPAQAIEIDAALGRRRPLG